MSFPFSSAQINSGPVSDSTNVSSSTTVSFQIAEFVVENVSVLLPGSSISRRIKSVGTVLPFT